MSTIDAVCFTFGEQRFAIDIDVVRRVARLPHLTPVPGAPRHFAGVANLRGNLVPIVDLALLLGGAPAHDADHIVAIGHSRDDIGILASTVTGIEAVPCETVTAAAAGQRQDARTVHRILPDGRALIDGAALLADPRLTAGATGLPAHPNEEPYR